MYYLFALIFRFDFGMEYTILSLFILFSVFLEYHSISQRWIFIAIEKLQSGAGLVAAFPYIFAVLTLAFLLFVITAWKTKRNGNIAL